MTMELIHYTLIGIDDVGTDVKKFTFKPINTKLHFEPGQFINLHFLGENNTPSELFRQYTIASSNNNENIELVIKLGKNFTVKLWEAKVGTQFGLSGPYGEVLDFNHQTILISGGVGISPVLSLLNSKSSFEQDMVLFNCNRTLDSIPCGDKINDLIKTKFKQNLKVINVLSREKDNELNINHETGYINSNMIKKHVPNYENYNFFVCGSSRFGTGVRKIFEELKIDQSKIKMEVWG